MNRRAFSNIALPSPHQQIDIGVAYRRVRPTTFVNNADAGLSNLRDCNRERQFPALVGQDDAVSVCNLSIPGVVRMQRDLRFAEPAPVALK